MDGIPKILDELPHYNRHRGPNSDHKKRQRAPSAPTSPTPGSSFGLDTISEKPKKSAMKQPRAAPGSTFNQSRFFAGTISGKPTENDATVYQPGLANNTVGAFDPSGTSFGVARGLPLGLQINTDVANEGSLGYASGAQVQMLTQMPGMDTVIAANAGAVIGKPPKTPTKSRWWRK